MSVDSFGLNNMDIRVRASTEQFLTLLNFMERHGDLSRPLYYGARGRLRSDRLWVELTKILNTVGGGVKKTSDKWKKVWADWKSKTKKKALILRHQTSLTANGSVNGPTLSAVDERVLAVSGTVPTVQSTFEENLGLNIPHSSVPSQASPPAPQDTDPLSLIEVSQQQKQSPSTPPLSPSWHQPSTSREQSPTTQLRGPPELMVLAPSPPLQGWQSVKPDPGTPEPKPEERPATSPSRLPPSPATHSTSIPRRPRLRSRRRRLTPLERVATQFAAVEMRRLDLEERRDRQHHEREMRALEVQHERTLMFNSIITIVQDWTNMYRSRTTDTEPMNTD